MEIKRINSTHYADIYSLSDDNGKVIGTKTVTLAGRNAGTTYQSWSSATKTDVRKMFKATERTA